MDIDIAHFNLMRDSKENIISNLKVFSPLKVGTLHPQRDLMSYKSGIKLYCSPYVCPNIDASENFCFTLMHGLWRGLCFLSRKSTRRNLQKIYFKALLGRWTHRRSWRLSINHCQLLCCCLEGASFTQIHLPPLWILHAFDTYLRYCYFSLSSYRYENRSIAKWPELSSKVWRFTDANDRSPRLSLYLGHNVLQQRKGSNSNYRKFVFLVNSWWFWNAIL